MDHVRARSRDIVIHSGARSEVAFASFESLFLNVHSEDITHVIVEWLFRNGQFAISTTQPCLSASSYGISARNKAYVPAQYWQKATGAFPHWQTGSQYL